MCKRRTIQTLLFALFLLVGTQQVATAAGSKASGNEQPKVGTIVKDCTDCPAMVVVPQVDHNTDNPGKVFYAGKFELTWRQYLVAVREGDCPAPMKNYTETQDANDPKINDEYPVTAIPPEVFPCYLRWLKKKTGETYRLPTAAEWEHIARAGTKTAYYWGDELGYNNAVVIDYFDAKALRKKLGEPETGARADPRNDVKWHDVYPVGQFEPNSWGLYDVIGNAGELTTESYKLPTYADCVKKLPVQKCQTLSLRGVARGRLEHPSKPNPSLTKSLTTERSWAPALGPSNHTGFRLVRN